MSDVTIKYKGQSIATMDASGTKTLGTQGKYCEGDIAVEYAKPAGPTGTKQISITQNGTTTEDVAAYANAEISVNVSGVGDTLGQWLENTLTSYENASITTVEEAGLGGGGTNLDLLSLPNVTSVKAYAFNATKAKRFYLPKLATMSGGQVFNNCSVVEKLALPAIADFGNGDYIFSNCTSLEKIDFGPLTPRLGRYFTFNYDSRLNTIVIRSSSVANVLSLNVFNGTPFASGGTGGTVYVPQALIASYQAATNWSVILGYANNSIQAIEGSAYENAYADGTPIT